ncbi:MAG: sigma-70 family RNA polymerase sigma factor [Bacteroidia bacterium]|nr:sigma-70 family RNA polymerase sigma factor [Bacteroidia bacterium]
MLPAPKQLLLFTTDSEILQGLKENSEEAFSALMKKHYEALFRYGQHFTKDETIVTDSLQDVFINLWENRQKADMISFLRPYLLKALKRRIIRVAGQRRKKIDLPGEKFEDYQFSLEFSIEDIIIEKQLAEEKAAKLRHILEQLPARQKEAIYLIYYQQLDHNQVAELMNITRQSVYNLLSESMVRIRTFWQNPSLLAILLPLL